MKHVFLGFTLFLLLLKSNPGSAQQIDQPTPDVFPFQTISGEFLKIYERNNVIDSVYSRFYFNSTPFMYIETKKPFHQIMIIKQKETLVYYPNRKLAYRLTSERPPLFPAISYLIAFFHAEEGFSNLGLNLQQQDFRGDTLITIWGSPDPKKKFGHYRLLQVNDQTIEVTYTSPDTSIINVLRFNDFTQINQVVLPQTIVSEQTSPKYYSIETIRLSGLKINLSIPPEYVNFQVPEDTKVVEKEW